MQLIVRRLEEEALAKQKGEWAAPEHLAALGDCAAML